MFQSGKRIKNVNYFVFFLSSFSAETVWKKGEETRNRPKTQTSLQRQTTGAPRERVQVGQVFVRLQEAGALQESQFDRGPDQDLVPKPAHQVEEANGRQAQVGPKTGFIAADSAARAAPFGSSPR